MGVHDRATIRRHLRSEHRNVPQNATFSDEIPNHRRYLSWALNIGTLRFVVLLTMKTTILLTLLLLWLPIAIAAQNSSSQLAIKRAEHLRHGINASEWFAQSPDYSLQRLSSYTTLEDIDLIGRLGFDHVRLSVDPVVFQCRGAWSSCPAITALDQVVNRAIGDHLAVIIDLHPTTQFKRELATSNSAAERFGILWQNIAQHFGSYNPDLVVFEVLNEPEFGDPYRWAGIEERVIARIRRAAPMRTIIVAGAQYSDIGDLMLLPQISDANLIYNFHYYEPHLFTHQGASWGMPYWIELRDVPYPATPESVQEAIMEQQDDLSKWELTELGFGRWDATRISGEMHFVGEWAKAHHVPLICNEFGVYRDFSHPQDRARWISDVRTALEQNGIGWTMWDYRGGFGVVSKSSGGTTADTSILRALGLAPR